MEKQKQLTCACGRVRDAREWKFTFSGEFRRITPNFFVGSLLLFQKRTSRLISLRVFLASVAKVVAFLSFSLYCVRRIFQFKGCESIFVVFFLRSLQVVCGGCTFASFSWY